MITPPSEKTPSKEMHSSCQEGCIAGKKLVQRMPVPRRQACPLTLDCPFLELTELLGTYHSRNVRLYAVLTLKQARVCLRVKCLPVRLGYQKIKHGPVIVKIPGSYRKPWLTGVLQQCRPVWLATRSRGYHTIPYTAAGAHACSLFAYTTGDLCPLNLS